MQWKLAVPVRLAACLAVLPCYCSRCSGKKTVNHEELQIVASLTPQSKTMEGSSTPDLTPSLELWIDTRKTLLMLKAELQKYATSLGIAPFSCNTCSNESEMSDHD